MKKLREKLNSNRGASLIIALLFFLICVMVSSVIVTAAVANVGRIDKQRDEEQAYLAAGSAAELLRDDFSAMSTFTATRVDIDYTCPYPEHQDSTGEWQAQNADGEDSGCTGAALCDYVTQAALSIRKGGAYWEQKFTLTADVPELSDVSVSADMYMDDDYNIKLILTATTEKDSSYTMSLNIAGNNVDDETVDDSTSCTHEEKSTQPVLVDGEWQYPVVEKHYTIYMTTYTTTVTWSAGTISKGV